MGLLTELNAFFTDHRDCADLDARVDCCLPNLDE
jgi:hypothetical protein